MEMLLERHAKGLPTPAIDNMPPRDWLVDMYLTAHDHLVASSNENGVIPISEIYAYYQMMDVQFEAEDFLKAMLKLNNVYVKYIMDKREAEMKKLESKHG